MQPNKHTHMITALTHHTILHATKSIDNPGDGLVHKGTQPTLLETRHYNMRALLQTTHITTPSLGQNRQQSMATDSRSHHHCLALKWKKVTR